MADVKTVPAKHIFLDVVGFTHQRSVEAQADIVGYLNNIVRKALAASGVLQEQLILLPTGDGMCIVLVDVPSPYDVHLTIALSILAQVQEHNEQAPDEMRRFTVRVGINENVDNLVVDVNERRNIAGAGINMAQRVMTFAEGNQVFVGSTVYETLRQRERYMSSFREFTTTIKHGLRLTAYQYLEYGRPGLDVSVPAAFAPKIPELQPLSRVVAFYLAHAITHRDFLLQHSDGLEGYSAVCLLWFLAEDSVDREETPSHKTSTTRAPKKDTIHAQLAELTNCPFWVIAELHHAITETNLELFAECFEYVGMMRDYLVVSPRGARRLAKDQPDIWRMFNLGDPAGADEPG